MPHPKDDPMTVTPRGSFFLTESQSLRVSQFNYLNCWTEFQFSTVLLRVLKWKYSASALARLRVKQPTCHGNVGGNRIRRKELDGRSNLTDRQERLGRTVGSAPTRVYGKMPTSKVMEIKSNCYPLAEFDLFCVSARAWQWMDLTLL